MTTEEISQIMAKLENLSGKVDRIYQGLYGVENTDEKGFCGELTALKKDYYKFKGRVLIILAFSAGGGGLLGAGILKWLGG